MKTRAVNKRQLFFFYKKGGNSENKIESEGLKHRTLRMCLEAPLRLQHRGYLIVWQPMSVPTIFK